MLDQSYLLPTVYNISQLRNLFAIDFWLRKKIKVPLIGGLATAETFIFAIFDAFSAFLLRKNRQLTADRAILRGAESSKID